MFDAPSHFVYLDRLHTVKQAIGKSVFFVKDDFWQFLFNRFPLGMSIRKICRGAPSPGLCARVPPGHVYVKAEI